ncbi:pentapeptide repeat-containing protein [Pseudovibrio brasiliensis]|uniref:Pentapeptide repeat-containing protein n=1 Tax=Pseudovibrio brasiliensis TaxID=1898042 RepID=A0ABX8AQF7_9HYPH|nr:pentapeptide repeat-containing protein [Pseudovibrio brasiliensis]QUS57335.1 pentapeptide repeat-containing protein [Pseudovibrio brasiliensis]
MFSRQVVTPETLDFRDYDEAQWNFWVEQTQGGFTNIWIDLSNANFEKAIISGASFVRTIISKSELIQTSFVKTDMSEANLDFSTFLNVSLENVCLERANLEAFQFRGGRSHQVQFTNADARRAEFDDVTFEDVDFTKANFEATTFSHCRLHSPVFTQARLANAVFEDCTGAEAKFRMAKLQNARIVSCNFVKANFNRARLKGANLSETNFEGANFRFANLQNTTCAETNFSNADLRNAILTDTNLLNTNLTNADLRGTNLVGSIYQQSQLRNAITDETTVLNDEQSPEQKPSVLGVDKFPLVFGSEENLHTSNKHETKEAIAEAASSEAATESAIAPADTPHALSESYAVDPRASSPEEPGDLLKNYQIMRVTTPISFVKTDGSEEKIILESVAIPLWGKGNQIGELFEKAVSQLVANGEATYAIESWFDALTQGWLTPEDKSRCFDAVKIALDEHKAVVYFGSVHDLSTKVLGGVTGFVTFVADTGVEQVAIGVLAMGTSLIFLQICQSVGKGASGVIEAKFEQIKRRMELADKEPEDS